MTAPDVPPPDLLPDRRLTARGPVAAAFRARGCTDVRAAAALVWRLPYGRNGDPLDPLCVLREGRGTCSTKHALIARLLDEAGVSGIELRLGIYAMSEANTPGVGVVLASHGLASIPLASIPEAHCVLVTAAGARIDLTRADATGTEPVGDFLAEEAIVPEQIGDFKRAFHRRFLAAQAAAGDGAHTAEELWAIREACIAALAAR